MLEEYWATVSELIQEEIPKITYETWIKTLTPVSMNEDTIILKIKTKFQKDYIQERYLDFIKNGFKIVTGKEYNVEIVTDNNSIETNVEINSAKEKNSILNPKYTFDTFVIGKSNELAHAVGLGKTHLMHAIGNYITSQKEDSKVIYITTEKFTNELIQAIQNNKTEEFRTKYRNIDVLLIDDIQFLMSKERSQEEFFHTFNELYENHKQIVICSDRPPKDINPLEERLKSRFEWGLIADIGKPDYETRYAILRKKSELDNIKIDDEILSTIALKVESNIRELEGTLNKIIALASLTNSEITMQLAENAIRDLHYTQDKVINIDYIQNVVAKYYNLSQSDFKIKRRSGDIAYPRQIAMYLCKQLTTSTLVEIGNQFGGRDHTTVLYACNRIEKEISINPNTKMIVDNIKKAILD